MMSRLYSAVLCILLLAGCGGDSSRQQSPPTPEPIQEEESAPARVIGMVGVVEKEGAPPVSTFKAAVSQESFEIIKHKTSGWVYFKHPEMMRIELTMLDPHSQIILVYTPDFLWEYDPERKVAERTDLAQLRAEFKNLVPPHLTGYIISDVALPFAPKHRYEKFQFKHVRNEVLSGEETRVYEASSKNPKGKEIQRVIVWVGDTDGFLRKKVKYLLGKKDLEEIFYNVELNSDIPDSLFEFTPPSGAKVIDRTEAYRKKLQAEERLRKRLGR